MTDQPDKLPEPVARLLDWCGPPHMRVPHGGVAARTFTEFPKETPVGDRYWMEGEPLYTADQLRAAILAAKMEERERAALLCELSPDAIRLLAGELTAQEMRSVRAVLANRAAAIRKGE